MDDQTRSRSDAACPAGCYDVMTKNQGHERIENHAAAPATSSANMPTPASATVEAWMVTSQGSWIDIGSGSVFSLSAAVSSSDEVVAHHECVAEVLQGTCDSTSYENGVHKRRDDIGKANEAPPTAEKGCSGTECRCERCRKSATAPGRDLSQGDCHIKAAERPARHYENRAVPPNLQSLPESVRRYLGSPMSASPWLPKGLLQDPSVVPNWIIDVAEEES